MSEESHSSEVLMHRLVSPGAQKSICRSDSREYQETSVVSQRSSEERELIWLEIRF